MPDSSDRVLDVVIDLLVTQGWEGVSVRRVATAASVSIGAVQHHFPTKEAMLGAAMDRAAQAFEQRLSERVPPDASAREALTALVDLLLGAEPDERDVSVLWLVQACRAAVDPATAERHAREWAEVEDLLARLLAAVRPDRDDGWRRDAAGTLLALLDGLAVAVVAEPARMPPDRARRLAAAGLERVLDG